MLGPGGAGEALARCAALFAITMTAACGSTRPEPPPGVTGAPPATGSAAPPVPASAASPDGAPQPVSTAAIDAGADPLAASNAPAEALDDATFERRTFRHVLVGALRYPPKRLTWVLFRSATRARLQVFCQVGQPPTQLGMSLDGKENDEARWRAPALSVYAGARVGETPLSYRFSATAGPRETECGVMPSGLRLQCRPEQASVLPAGAALIPGKRADDERTPARWQPSTRAQVAALRCDLAVEGDPAKWPFPSLMREWPLVFAAPRDGAPGVEWAHENSDQVVQEGSYRWMPAPR